MFLDNLLGLIYRGVGLEHWNMLRYQIQFFWADGIELDWTQKFSPNQELSLYPFQRNTINHYLHLNRRLKCLWLSSKSNTNFHGCVKN